jgi:hypothetical protein
MTPVQPVQAAAALVKRLQSLQVIERNIAAQKEETTQQTSRSLVCLDMAQLKSQKGTNFLHNPVHAAQLLACRDGGYRSKSMRLRQVTPAYRHHEKTEQGGPVRFVNRTI